MKHITIKALAGTGCLLVFIRSLVSGLVRYLVHNSTSLLSAPLHSSGVPRIQQGICISKTEQRAITYR